LVRFLTRPTNHPRHAACASNDESKPVRPLLCLNNYGILRSYARQREHCVHPFCVLRLNEEDIQDGDGNNISVIS